MLQPWESSITNANASMQHNLRHALAQWRHWQCDPPLQHAPEIVSPVAGGLSNHSVLVTSGAQFIVRIDGTAPTSHGLNRQMEWRALRQASAAGLAPTPRYFNPDIGCLVCDYLPPDAAPRESPADTAQLLRGIHALPALHHRLDLCERIQRYENQLRRTAQAHSAPVLAHSDRVLSLAHSAALSCDSYRVCHHDLLRANRLFSGGRLYALDWEYCAMGDPLYDLAVVIAGDALDETQQDALLRAYLQRPPKESELCALARYGCVYRYLEILWYLAANKNFAQGDAMQIKLAQLDSALRVSA
ncbi:MAG: hypothetical protein Hals2KO_38210 [Halioglobus sp.]